MTSQEHYLLAKQKAARFGLDLLRSTRLKHKYMFMNPETGKMVHFGRIGFSDFLEHNDPIRRDNYRRRHAGIINKYGYPAYMVKYSPSWASYNILW